MSYAPNSLLSTLTGQFRNTETDAVFDYAPRQGFPEGFASDFDQMVYVGPNGETRLARVLKTVAYVVVDEDADGEPVTEKWAIKRHQVYAGRG